MENKFNSFYKDNKGFAIFYLVWIIINLILIIIQPPHFIDSSLSFWPFGSWSRVYYTGDFILYLVIPLVLWGIWKLIGADANKLIKD